MPQMPVENVVHAETCSLGSRGLKCPTGSPTGPSLGPGLAARLGIQWVHLSVHDSTGS